MTIFLITNYLNTLHEIDETYIGYKSSYEEAHSYINSKLNVSHLGVNPDSEYWFSDGYETYIIREVEELK
jgi:hypothetical protein